MVPFAESDSLELGLPPYLPLSASTQEAFVNMWVFLKTVDLTKEQNVTVPYSVFMSCFIPFWV